ncbi:MAG: hypothetical protein V2I33_22675 [Kangiellaceae bacterium]|jgi:hypothetical protein|nr:hypothetical protein [Kangiellaceae bacterium]
MLNGSEWERLPNLPYPMEEVAATTFRDKLYCVDRFTARFVEFDPLKTTYNGHNRPPFVQTRKLPCTAKANLIALAKITVVVDEKLNTVSKVSEFFAH